MEYKSLEEHLWRAMARGMERGHLVRTGHELVAHLERIGDDAGGYPLYRIVRECCEEKR